MKSCDTCKRLKELPRYYNNLSRPLTSFFEVLPIDFAEPLPKASNGSQCLLICVKHLTNWPLAKATNDKNYETVIKYVEEYILHTFGQLNTIIGDNVFCFLAMVLKKFVDDPRITWKRVLEYAPM